MQVVSLLLAIFKAVPMLKDIFDKIVAAYIQSEEAKLNLELENAIKKAALKHDQIDLEKQIGYSKAGEKSGHEGTVIVKHLPID